jgi:hypothetical protein
MKLTLSAALLVAASATSHAFTFNFSGYEGSELPPTVIEAPVPGYGTVRFVDNTHQNSDGSGAPSLSFQTNESVKVTFIGLNPKDVNFDFVGVSTGEYFVTELDPVTPQAYIVTMRGVSGNAGLYAVDWNQIPEPSSALLGVLAGAVCVLRRRR